MLEALKHMEYHHKEITKQCTYATTVGWFIGIIVVIKLPEGILDINMQDAHAYAVLTVFFVRLCIGGFLGLVLGSILWSTWYSVVNDSGHIIKWVKRSKGSQMTYFVKLGQFFSLYVAQGFNKASRRTK